MSGNHAIDNDVTVNGSKTRRWVLESDQCKELAAYRIGRLGIDDALAPYERVRTRPEGSFLMATASGVGRVLLDGKWQKVRSGTVCMAPPRVLNAFAAERGGTWSFGWIRYAEPPHVKNLVGATAPVRVHGGADFIRALEGLREEWNGARDPKIIHHWVELVHGFVRRLASPFRGDERLARIWEAVREDLTYPWSLEELAGRCYVSPEHLRRICHRELGRTPMQQVASIRMEAARRMLEHTNEKMETIALTVGYANASIFSRVFRRVVGMPPNHYRLGDSPE
jgi:AraC-like DNA-binding protein